MGRGKPLTVRGFVQNDAGEWVNIDNLNEAQRKEFGDKLADRMIASFQDSFNRGTLFKKGI